MRTPSITLAALLFIVAPVLAQPSASSTPPEPSDSVGIHVETPAFDQTFPGSSGGPQSIYVVDHTQYNVRKVNVSNRPSENAATALNSNDTGMEVAGFPGGPQSIYVVDHTQYNVQKVIVRSGLSASAGYNLADVAPNPVMESATISYTLPQAGHTNLTVFDATGRVVATLVDDEVPAGTHSVSFDAGNLTAGRYLYRLSAGSFTETKTLNVVR